MRSRPQSKETARSMPPHPAQVFHQVFFCCCFNISFGLRNRKLVVHIVTRCRWIHWSEKTADFSRRHKRFPAKWRLSNDCRNSILMTCHSPDLGFFNQSKALPRSTVGSDSSSVWNFCARSSDVILRANQWTAVSRNVGGFFRPATQWNFFYIHNNEGGRYFNSPRSIY